MANPIPITTLVAGVLAVAQLPLTFLVSYTRARTRIEFLHAGNDTLLRRIRAHGNFTETVPITLLVMACAELAGASSQSLWAGGASLLVGRAVHVGAMLSPRGWGWPRMVAMGLTFYAMTGFGIACIRASFS